MDTIERSNFSLWIFINIRNRLQEAWDQHKEENIRQNKYIEESNQQQNEVEEGILLFGITSIWQEDRPTSPNKKSDVGLAGGE